MISISILNLGKRTSSEKKRYLKINKFADICIIQFLLIAEIAWKRDFHKRLNFSKSNKAGVMLHTGIKTSRYNKQNSKGEH